MPLYSGGLCEAVKLMAPSAFSRMMACAMTDKRIVFTSTGDRKEAEDIAWGLVERKLAACVNIVQVESVYRWKGEIEKHPEHLLIIKTTAKAGERIRAALAELHSYEIPECIELPIEAGSEKYLDWLSQSVE